MTGATRERALVGIELDRVLTRLTGLGPARLSRADGGPSAADLVRPLLQQLADAAADAQGRPRRDVPVLADRAVPDQLAVLGADVLDPARHDPPGRVRDAHLPEPVLTVLAGRLAVLRRSLP